MKVEFRWYEQWSRHLQVGIISTTECVQLHESTVASAANQPTLCAFVHKKPHPLAMSSYSDKMPIVDQCPPSRRTRCGQKISSSVPIC